MRSIEDVFDHISQIERPLGGNISLEAVEALSKVFLLGEAREAIPTQYALADGSSFYVIDDEFCGSLASAEHEDLLDASVPWSQDELWKSADVNRFDLAGFILGMAELCKQKVDGKSLFVLVSNEG